MPIRPEMQPLYPPKAEWGPRLRLSAELEWRIIRGLSFTDFCWEWTKSRSSAGYGRINVEGRVQYVHRLMLESAMGRPFRPGEHTDHLCRNPACARPSHLEAVSCAENAQRGLTAKLTRHQVDSIRRMRIEGQTTVALSKMFGIHSSEISRICTLQRFKPVDGQPADHVRQATETRAKAAAAATGQLSLFGEIA